MVNNVTVPRTNRHGQSLEIREGLLDSRGLIPTERAYKGRFHFDPISLAACFELTRATLNSSANSLPVLVKKCPFLKRSNHDNSWRNNNTLEESGETLVYITL